MVNVSKSVFKSFNVTTDSGEELRIDVGMPVKFTTEDDGEVVRGILTDISKKKDKTVIKIRPYDAQKEELWKVEVMAEGSLVIDDEA